MKNATTQGIKMLETMIAMQSKALLGAEIADRPRIREEIAGMEARLQELRAR